MTAMPVPKMFLSVHKLDRFVAPGCYDSDMRDHSHGYAILIMLKDTNAYFIKPNHTYPCESSLAARDLFLT